MTNGRTSGLCAGLILLAPLMSSCVYLDVFTPAGPNLSNANVIPDGVRDALGCDTSLRGSGLGVDGRQTEMLDGYRPASLKGGPAMSVFWCARSDNNFVLAFVRNGRLTHPECPSAFIWPYSPKAALSISNQPAPLAEFGYVDDVNHTNEAPGKRSRPTGRTNGSVVVDGDDSLSNEFYCHKGTWMVRARD
jgi:hypothetical protein